MTGCVGLLSASLQDPLLTVDLILLLIDDESKCSYFVFARIRAHRYFARVDTPRVPNLSLCDESAAGSLSIMTIVGSAPVPISVRCHHTMYAKRQSRVVADFAL
jgi:hypothetical protein